MLSLKDNRTALINLEGTIDAIERLEKLIDTYSDPKPGPAYCVFELQRGQDGTRVQFDRSIIVTALEAQRTRLVSYLATLGIDANS